MAATDWKVLLVGEEMGGVFDELKGKLETAGYRVDAVKEFSGFQRHLEAARGNKSHYIAILVDEELPDIETTPFRSDWSDDEDEPPKKTYAPCNAERIASHVEFVKGFEEMPLNMMAGHRGLQDIQRTKVVVLGKGEEAPPTPEGAVASYGRPIDTVVLLKKIATFKEEE